MTTPELVEQALCAELRATREHLGLNRADAAARYRDATGQDMTPRSLLAYERGERHVSVQRLLEFGHAYGIPASLLLIQAERKAGQDPTCPTCGTDLTEQS